MEGKDVQASFVGVAFHGVDGSTNLADSENRA